MKEKFNRIKGYAFRVMDVVSSHHTGAYAAQAAYFFVLSMIPIILLLLTMVQFTSLTKDYIMKNKIIQLLQSTAGMLIFALLSGCAYYIVVLKFILSHTSVGGGLLGFFFLPAIIFGAALVLIKIIKQCMENGNYNAVNLIFWLHIVFIIISAVFLVSMFV